MNNQRVSWKAISALIIITVISGCIPEDSLKWSEDGSVGLLYIDDFLSIVDGQSDELTEIEKENVDLANKRISKYLEEQRKTKLDDFLPSSKKE